MSEVALYHASPFEHQSKVIFGRFCQLLAIDAHKMAPSTGQWLQVRVWDTPTKGLLWEQAYPDVSMEVCFETFLT